MSVSKFALAGLLTTIQALSLSFALLPAVAAQRWGF